MKRWARPIVVLAVAALVTVGAPVGPGAHAAVVGTSSVSGEYTFELQGENPISVNNLPSRTAFVGIVTFDGAGGVTGSATGIHAQFCCVTGTSSTTPEQVLSETGTFTGTYVVNPDHTALLDFTIVATLNPGNVPVTEEIKLAAAFSADFKRFKFIQTFQSDATNGNAPLPDSILSGRGEKVTR